MGDTPQFERRDLQPDDDAILAQGRSAERSAYERPELVRLDVAGGTEAGPSAGIDGLIGNS
jgi:hypothetical protein